MDTKTSHIQYIPSLSSRSPTAADSDSKERVLTSQGTLALLLAGAVSNYNFPHNLSNLMK